VWFIKIALILLYRHLKSFVKAESRTGSALERTLRTYFQTAPTQTTATTLHKAKKKDFSFFLALVPRYPQYQFLLHFFVQVNCA
jgi:hypothetical protein